MAERPIGVTDSPSGAGIAQIRTRERTVGAESVVEQYLIPTTERVPSARRMCSTFRTVGVATVNTNLASLFNKTGSGVLVAVRQVIVAIDPVGASGTVRSMAASRITTAPTTGTLLTPVQFDTADTGSANVEMRGATASDGGAATTLTATPGAYAWMSLTTHAVSVIGQIIPRNETVVPELMAFDPGTLREGEGLLLTNVEAASTGSHYFVSIAWDEFTLP